MLAVAGPGEKLLISRNAHKSVISGVIVNGTVPVWVKPTWDRQRHVAHPPEPDDVRRQLEAHPDAKGMLLITPTDWGTCADIRGVAEVCHAHDVPLIVDEAWGAHLPFHEELPTWGMDAEADIVVTSVHKMGAAVEQSSVFHLQGDRVDPRVLKQREDLLGTTSSSSLVYGSLDGWRRQMVERGHELMTGALGLARRLHREIAAIEGIVPMGAEVVEEGYAAQIDPMVISMDVRGLGITGYQAAELVRARSHLDLASADAVRVNVRITHGDDDLAGERLLDALHDLASVAPSVPISGEVRLPEPGELDLETVMRPRDAFFAPVEQVPVADAVGRVAAEMVTPYPPGVPAIAPGERITQAVLDYLRSGVDAGMLIPEAADPTVKTLRVVRG
jgi:arginine/lysine/ornithine decarboxylase